MPPAVPILGVAFLLSVCGGVKYLGYVSPSPISYAITRLSLPSVILTFSYIFFVLFD